MKKMPFLFPTLCLFTFGRPLPLSSFLPLFTQVLPYQSVIAQLEGDERNWLEEICSAFCVRPVNYCVGKHLSCFI